MRRWDRCVTPVAIAECRAGPRPRVRWPARPRRRGGGDRGEREAAQVLDAGERSRASPSPSPRQRLTTRSIVAMPSSSASRAVSRPTWTELNVGSTTTSARSNPRASARPKCSTPAWVSMMTTSPRRNLMPAIVAASRAFSGQRQPPPARCTPPITRSRTPSGASTPRRSTTSAVSGFEPQHRGRARRRAAPRSSPRRSPRPTPPARRATSPPVDSERRAEVALLVGVDGEHVGAEARQFARAWRSAWTCRRRPCRPRRCAPPGRRRLGSARTRRRG